MATAVMLGPALAHLFELPAKMALPRDQYFVVQQIYQGWNSFVLVVAVQLLSLLTTAWLTRREPRVVIPTLIAVLLIVADQVLFWLYTQPTNVTTASWTLQTDDWATLRRHWEYSHLVGAGLQLLAMASLSIAVVSRLPARRREYLYF
jgi:hypothetical protein